jgi:hypothetical protein
VDITLPSGALWYEALAGQSVHVEKPGQVLTTAVNMDAIPVFYRGGAIVPRRCDPGCPLYMCAACHLSLGGCVFFSVKALRIFSQTTSHQVQLLLACP